MTGTSVVDPDRPVITVSNGLVRWYPDVWSAERNHVMLTASASGVSIHTKYLHEIPASWLHNAIGIHAALKANPSSDFTHIATHTNSVTSNGPLVPVGETH